MFYTVIATRHKITEAQEDMPCDMVLARFDDLDEARNYKMTSEQLAQSKEWEFTHYEICPKGWAELHSGYAPFMSKPIGKAG